MLDAGLSQQLSLPAVSAGKPAAGQRVMVTPPEYAGTAVKGGRDADSITCNSAAWLGALAGNDVWPRKWSETVQKANLHRMDLRRTAKDLIDKGLKDGTVALSAL